MRKVWLAVTRGNMVPGMALIRRRVCRYKCGTCGWEYIARWGEFQAHYESHLTNPTPSI